MNEFDKSQKHWHDRDRDHVRATEGILTAIGQMKTEIASLKLKVEVNTSQIGSHETALLHIVSAVRHVMSAVRERMFK